MPSKRESPLVWFPIETREWAERCAELSPEQEGALFRACRVAWRAVVPCTIGADRGAFDALLGTRARSLAPFLRTEFTPHPLHPDRLVCGWLLELFIRQTERYHANREKGQKGGRPPRHGQHGKPQPYRNGKPKGKPEETSGFPQVYPQLNPSSEVRGNVVPDSFQESGNYGSPAAGAAAAGAAPGGALAAAAGADRANGHHPAAPDAAPPEPVPPGTIAAAWAALPPDAEPSRPADPPPPPVDWRARKAERLAALGVAPRNVFAERPAAGEPHLDPEPVS